MYRLLPTSGSQRLRSPKIPSTSAVTPASSATSRRTACSMVSSGSINPPGTCQLPRPRREARRTNKSRPSWTTAPPTPTLYPVLYRAGGGIGLLYSVSECTIVDHYVPGHTFYAFVPPFIKGG